MPIRRSTTRPSLANPPASSGAPLSPDVADVFASLRRLVHALHSATRDTEERLGLTSAQLFVLTQLKATPSLSINALAERTMTHQSTVSVVVRRLVQRKLVRKVRAVGDARRVELTLTSTGSALMRRAPEAMQTTLARSIETLGDEERHVLAGALARLVTSIGADTDPETMFFQDGSTGDG